MIKFSMNRKKKALLLSVMILGSLSHSAYAASGGADSPVKTRDVVVSATRTEQEVKETPAGVEVITREEIDRLGGESVTSVLRTALNLNLSEAGMVGNQVSLRGMNSNQTLILVDGRRLAGEDTNMTQNQYELNRVNIDNVERIEIVRGPVSSMYGSDALGGVINIIMKEPVKKQASVRLGTGTKQKDLGVHVDLGKEGKWLWSGDMRFSDIRERQIAAENTNMFGDRSNYYVTGIYDINGASKLKVFFDYMDENLKEKYTGGNVERWDNKRREFGAVYSEEDKNGNLEISTYYNKLEKKDITREASGSVADFDYAKYDMWVLEAKRSTQLNDSHLLTYGGEYRETTYAGTRLGNSNNHVFDKTYGSVTKKGSEESIDYYAFYVQDEWVANDKLLIIPSLRYDDSDKFGDNLSPKIGMTYKLSDDSRIKTSFGKGYKAPTISELYQNFTRSMGRMNVSVLGNSNLKPEESTTYEFSFEAEKNNNFGKITYFHNDVDNLITTRLISSGYVPGLGMVVKNQYENIDEAKIDGIELEAGRRLDDKWTLQTVYTYLDAVDKSDGERLENRAKHKVSLQLLYDNTAADGVSGMLWNEWNDEYLYDGKNYSYSLLNLSLQKKFSDKYSLYFGVDNLLDKKIDAIYLDGQVWRMGVNLTI